MVSLAVTRLLKSGWARRAAALTWFALSGCEGMVALGTLTEDAALIDASTGGLDAPGPSFGRLGQDGGAADATDATGDDAASAGARVTLHRCQGSVARAGCARVDGDWDHCFSRTRKLCDCADVAGDPALIWQSDGVRLSLYPDRPGPDAQTIDGLELERLYGCVDVRQHERRYVLAGDAYRSRSGVTCRPVGFVAATEPPDAGALPVWEYHLPIATDYLYSTGEHVEDLPSVCDPAAPRIVWWAWE
jgi:hypothetical protein